MSTGYLLLAVILVGSVGCARTAVTAGSRVPARSTAAAGALVYDDTQRTIPAGQEVDVRLQRALSSKTVKSNEAFQTTTVADLRNGARVLVPAGSLVRGVVRAVDAATPANRGGRIALSFTELTANGHAVVLEGTMTHLFEDGGVPDERETTASEGTLTGGVLRRLDANVTASVIGADGAVAAAQPGTDVVLPAGAIIRIRMNVPVEIR